MELANQNSNLSKIEPAQYYPWEKGVYDVAPHLKSLATDFGNGIADSQCFQIDNEYDKFIANKRECYENRKALHVGEYQLQNSVQSYILEWMKAQHQREHSDFHSNKSNNLDDFSLTVQEDFTIVQIENNCDSVAYVNVCAPSHWDPIEKLGLSFVNVHSVVPHFEKINRVSPAILDAMLHRSPFVRFVYGLQSDDRLNHHPVPNIGIDEATWLGQDYSKNLFVRTERQVIIGFPEINAVLFLIRVHQLPIEKILTRKGSFNKLIQSVSSMSQESREYKGINSTWEIAVTKYIEPSPVA